MYQLIKVDGETAYNPYRSAVPEFVSDYSQAFEFDADGLGNMVSKVSSETVSPQKSIGDNLNYQFDYVYDENYAHRLVRAGERYYQYDENGNVTCEQDGDFDGADEPVTYHKITKEAEDVYSTDYGWGLFKDDDKSGGTSATRYRRTYEWDEKNRLISSVDANYSTAYVYGHDGQRSNKYTQSSETLYFNKMWTLHTDSGNSVYGGQTAKNIYLGDTRIVTKLNSGSDPTYQEEYYKQYYYHGDHLGSASLISDYKGDEYQRIEYTPYGETWVEKTSNTGLEFLPYKFTAKELDKETGLYYYGARYLDPKYSRWISTDPALGEYMRGSSAGEGGAYNSVNLNLYHYGNNNPVKYSDPDGNFVETAWDVFSLVTGTASFVADVKAGNVKGAIIDGLGIIADAAAVALPCIPGGAGAAIKATRAVGAVANIAGGVLSVQDGLENGNYVEAGLGALQATAGIGQCVGLAKRILNEKKALDFYISSGMSKGDAKSHMQGIDFSKKVNVTNLSEGTIVDQYQARGKPQGNYYTTQGGNPNNLGIDITGRVKNSYTVNQPTRVLESTAANTTKTKLQNSCRGQGGGTQYFSTDYKNFTPME